MISACHNQFRPNVESDGRNKIYQAHDRCNFLSTVLMALACIGLAEQCFRSSTAYTGAHFLHPINHCLGSLDKQICGTTFTSLKLERQEGIRLFCCHNCSFFACCSLDFFNFTATNLRSFFYIKLFDDFDECIKVFCEFFDVFFIV